MNVHGKRALLNGPGFQSTAAVVAEIEDTGDPKPGQKRSKHHPSYPTFQVANCDRSVAFDLEGFQTHPTVGERKAAMANDLYKLDTLIDALQALREGVVIEQERYWQRKT